MQEDSPPAMDPNQAQMSHQIQSPPFAYHLNHNYRRDMPSSATGQPAHLVNMNGSEMPMKTEGMGAPPAQAMWTTPISAGMRPRPATIHEGFSYCMEEGYDALPAWDSSTSAIAAPTAADASDTVSSRPISVHQEFLPRQAWMVKPMEDSLEMHGIDAEMAIGQAYTADEAIPILDLRYPDSLLRVKP
ncbi:hypothetical protein OPQ81_000082 [Rhizoctonia solani]|nr:hypothetical protein OPQ81_000082 [Rhizoctonia solani]